jgi:nucleotide-binding universal stress UspA family protein
MIRKILVALDGSMQANKALDLAIDMAKAFGADLLALHVISDKPLSEGERRLAEVEYQEEVREALGRADFRTDPGATQATVEGLMRTSLNVALVVHTTLGRKILSHAEEEAKRRGAKSVKTVTRDGDPATVIVDLVGKEKPDLLIMGSRGLGGIQGLLMGSVSHKVILAAPCTVVVAK